MITCQNIKQMAKVNMKAGKSFIFKASLLLLAISLILSLLVTQLSGINRYMTNINNIVAEINSKPEMLVNPTEDFINEIADELMNAAPKIAPAAYVLITVIILMNGMLKAGFEGYCLKVTRKEEAKVLDILRSFEHFGKALCLLIIRSVAVAVGMLFFVAPGIIAHYAFSQCYMIMYDHPEYSVFKCLKESAKLMRGHKMMFFVLQFSFFFWYFAENLLMQFTVVNLLQIYTRPFIGISQAHFYNLLARPEMYITQQEAQQ